MHTLASRTRPIRWAVTAAMTAAILTGCEHPLGVPAGPTPARPEAAAAHFDLPLATLEHLDRQAAALQRNAATAKLVDGGATASPGEVERLRAALDALQRGIESANTPFAAP